MIFTYGSGLNDSIFGKSQAPITMFLEKRGEYWENNSMIDVLFDVQSANSWGEKATSMTGMDGWLPVGENGPHPVDEMQEGYNKVLEYEVWKNSFYISREAIDDAKMINLKQKPQAFIDAYYRTRERFAAGLYGAAALGQKQLDFRGKKFDLTVADGSNLFATAHKPKVKGGNQSNLFSDTFSKEALGKLETRMQGFKGDMGEELDIAPDTILIPNDFALKSAVLEVVGSDKDPETNNNAMNIQYGRWNVIIWQGLNQYLKDGQWLLLDSKYLKNYNANRWRNRVDLEITSAIDRNTNANVWDGYARFGADFVDWRFAAIGGVSGGDAL